jgi:hypothetical protein
MENRFKPNDKVLLATFKKHLLQNFSIRGLFQYFRLKKRLKQQW